MIWIRYRLPMLNKHRISDQIAELLVHVARTARSENAGSGLTAAQWTCLRFFARCNGSTRTPSAFASFQATTRGTASQIIKSLERRGLITRSRSDRDRRSVSFYLTAPGRAALSRDPLDDLVGLIDGLGSVERNRFLATLSRLTSALALRRAVPAFGTCRDCRHYDTDQGTVYCTCLAANLAVDDTSKLCARYTPAPGPKTKGDRHGAA